MKKQLFLLLLSVLLLLGACAPGEQPPESDEFLYYFPGEDSSVAVMLWERGPVDGGQLSLQALTTHYLNAAVPEGAQSVLPERWSLRSVVPEGNTAVLVLEGIPAKEIDCAVHLSCIAKTLLQHPQVKELRFHVPGRQEPFVLTGNDILLEDTSMYPQEEQVLLYFPDSNLRYLTAVTQSLSSQEAKNKPEYILRQILDPERNTCIPQGTQLLSVSVENGLCTVDLSWEFVEHMLPDFAVERMAVYSIVNSLTRLPQISTVDLWVAGAPLESLNYLDLRNGVTADEEMFRTPPGANLLDVNLYPTCGDTGLLVPVPQILETEQSEDTVAALVEQLIAMEDRSGLYNCIPAGTKLLSVRMEDSVCVLDFTGEFVNGCADARQEALAVRSVIATVCSLENIGAVEILVEGLAPAFRDSSLQTLRQPAAGWFVQ